MRNTVWVISIFLASSSTDASARAHRVPRPLPPSADVVDIAVLAPPASPATIEQTYGDAAFARSRYQRADRREERDAEAVGLIGTPYPCEPRHAGPRAYRCANPPGPTGYGQYYAFTPAAVTAPQIELADPNAQTAVLPPRTDIFWAANSLHLDPHD